MTIPELLPGSPKLGMVKFSLCSITDDLIKVFQNASGLHQSQIGSLALTANFLNLKNEVAKSLRPFRKPPLRSMSGLSHQSYNMRRRVQNDNVNCCGDTHARTHANLYARTHARTRLPDARPKAALERERERERSRQRKLWGEGQSKGWVTSARPGRRVQKFVPIGRAFVSN